MEINSTLQLQNYLFLLNESCNKNKLQIKISSDKFNIKKQLNLFFNNLTSYKFVNSYDVLHPNLIEFLIINEICTINRETKKYNKYNKIICYLKNDNNDKIYISKQIYFGYIFFKELSKYSNNKYIKNFFDKDGYINNLKTEQWVRIWNGVKNTRRLDFVLEIGNNKKIVIEYLENHHKEEIKEWNIYQTIRLVDILFGDMKNNIIHCAFIWDDNFSQEYISQKVRFIKNIIKSRY